MFVKYTSSQSLRLAVVMRRSAGVTRWARWVWRAVGVVPGVASADWKVMRQDGDVTDYLAGAHDVFLYVSDTEAYVHELGSAQPSVYIILREEPGAEPAGLDVVHVTVSPYEAQDYSDSGEEIVEKVPMPDAVLAWVHDFVETHHVDEAFVKRRRNKARVDHKQSGIGDSRISQDSDVYRAPTAARHEAAE